MAEISKSIPNRPLTHRFPVYHRHNFVGYLRLTSDEKGQLTRGNALMHMVGESKPLKGMGYARALLRFQEKFLFEELKLSAGVYLLSPDLTKSGKPKVVLYLNRPIKDLPWSQRLLLKDEIREGN